MIVLSPHLDDAVWSCHELLLSECRRATVVTICAAIPDPGVGPTQFDTRAGFKTAQGAMRARRTEDLAAGLLVGFTPRHLDYLDHGYGGGDFEPAVAQALAHVEPNEMVVGPLGLHHPDHHAIAAAFQRHARAHNLNAWVYEELPYSYTQPETVGPALKAAGVADAIATPSSPGKALAAETYASQTRNWHRDAILGVERLHRLRTDWPAA